MKNTLFIVLGLITLVLVALLMWGNFDTVQEDSNVYVAEVSKYSTLADMLEKKQINYFRITGGGQVVVEDVYLRPDKKTAGVEYTPVSGEQIPYDEALEMIGFSEDEVLLAVKQLEEVNSIVVTNSVGGILPEDIVAFCREDLCSEGVMYTNQDQEVEIVREKLNQFGHSEISLESTEANSLFIFRTEGLY